MSQEISGKYEPIHIEERWNKYWMDNKLFKSVPDERPSYTIVIPPPNVTGVLHMGHMLNNTIQDVLIRRARMRGFNACWVPGTDHASIATEAKVVQKLRKEGIKKSDLSRDEFLEHAWEWTHKHGGIILEQLKKLGASCDWDRTRFTMDEKYYESVIDTFIDLYKKGKIYRGERMINWDPAALTALSDEEVIYKEIDSKLFYVKYAIAGSNNEFVTIATTRPETILGDTAICINPKDERYMHLHGKKAIVPLLNREIPIITDEYVEMEFGTGCLKVTPAHDMNDFMLGEKHKLQVINMMNADGTISEAGQLYVGMDRFEVRSKIVEDLEAAGNLVKTEVHINKVGFSERTDVIIEPRLSLQWFVDMKDLSKPALDNVMNDNIRFFPPKFKNSYRNWMENIKDWCISRQLWWGHRIPAYYAPDGTFAVAKTDDEAFAQLSAKVPGLKREDMIQDPDVLDTWFSSWLWPISVFDGFYTEDEVKYYYPTADLVTAPEIMFFWVARMIIAGYEYRGELPFKNVYYTGIVRDKQGRKMSKSLGNSPDPLDLMAKYGADGVRVGMLLSSPAGNDLLFDEGLCEQGRNFANKIWNAFRLVKSWEEKLDDQLSQPSSSAIAIEWMESKFNQVLTQLNDDYEKFRINEALMNTYKLIWDDFCAWYLEMVKPPYGQGMDRKTYEASVAIFEKLLKVLHPFMPYLSEEIWHQLGQRDGAQNSICLATWPEVSSINFDLDRFENLKDIVTNIRAFRQEQKIKNTIKIDCFVNEVPMLVTPAFPESNPFGFPLNFSLCFFNNPSAFKYFTVNSGSYSNEKRQLSIQFSNANNPVSSITFDGIVGDLPIQIDYLNQFQNEIKTLKIDQKEISSWKTYELLNVQMNSNIEMLSSKGIHLSPRTDRPIYITFGSKANLRNHDSKGIYIWQEGQFDISLELKSPSFVEFHSLLQKLAFVGEISRTVTPIQHSFTISESYSLLSIPYSEDVDVEAEKKKIADELEYTRGFLRSVESKLNNEKFVNNAPEKVLEGERKKQADALEKIQLLEQKLASLN